MGVRWKVSFPGCVTLPVTPFIPQHHPICITFGGHHPTVTDVVGGKEAFRRGKGGGVPTICLLKTPTGASLAFIKAATLYYAVRRAYWRGGGMSQTPR